jgi:O-antigen/teichoic acid export membrane protein
VSRVLIALSVVAPLVVAGAALLLLGKVLAGSWMWGAVVFATFLVVYAVAVVLMRRWAMHNRERAEDFVSAWGRAMAFGSGGWEPRRRERERKPED